VKASAIQCRNYAILPTLATSGINCSVLSGGGMLGGVIAVHSRRCFCQKASPMLMTLQSYPIP